MEKIVFIDNGTLLNGLKAGKEEAFRYVFDKYYAVVRRNILKLVADECAAEDLLQECFVTLWEKRNELSDAVDLGGWLFTTSYYKSMSHLRNSVKLPVINRDSFPENVGIDTADQQEEAHQAYTHRMSLLNKAIQALPAQRQKALVLCKLQGESYENVAREMNLSEGTIRQYIKLSVASLKNSLNSK